MKTRFRFAQSQYFHKRFLATICSLVPLLGGHAGYGQTNAVAPGLNSWQQRRSAINATFANSPLSWSRTNFSSIANAKAAMTGGRKATIASAGPHHRLWMLSNTNAASNSGAVGTPGPTSQGRVMEIGSGINYWDGQNWSPSDATLEVSPEGDAFVANRLCYKLRLQADNLNTPGAITLTTPDGKVLKSTPIAIGLYDAASGQTMVLAVVTNSVGILVSSNKVVYENAFNENGVQASVICTAERGSFAADIVLTSRLDPTDFGFPAKTTRIQMITEYYDAPEPERIRTAIRVETDPALRQSMATPDLVDETLGFGELAFGRGLAYTITNTSSAFPDGSAGRAATGGAIVAKEFTSAAGRTFLVESVEYPSIQKSIQTLPQTKPKGAFLRPKRGIKKSEYARLPEAGKAGSKPVAKRNRSEMASITPAKLSGVCIDPVEYVDTSINTAKVFQGDLTYFIAAPIYCNGPVTIEGGAVFKYPNSTGPHATTAFLQPNNTLTFKSTQYRPVIFTAGDDDTVGSPGWLAWPYWSGDTTGKSYANPAIVTANFLSISNCRFLYANIAAACNGWDSVSVTVEHSQFISCIQGISIINYSSGTGALAVDVNNCLMANVNYLLESNMDSSPGLSVSLTHCTIANASYLKGPGTGCYVSIFAVNTIFSNVGGLSADYDPYVVTISGDYNGFYASGLPQFGDHNPDPPGQSPFQTSGGGNYYLSGGSFRGKGSTAIDPAVLSALKTRTTQPPIDFPAHMLMTGDLTLFPQIPRYVSGAPDLGYHYDALDFTVAELRVFGGSVTVLPGTAIGMRNDFFPESPDWSQPWDYTLYGFDLFAGSTFTSQGFANRPNTFADVQLVQESVKNPILCAFGLDYRRFAEGLPPTLNFRFSNFYFGDFNLHGIDDENNLWWNDTSTFTFGGGYFPDTIGIVTYTSAAFLGMRDCNLYGGQISFGQPLQDISTTPSAVTWFNNVFDRVAISVDPNEPDLNDFIVYVDMTFAAYNNTFHGGSWFHLNPLAPDGVPRWTFKDNLFDKVNFAQFEASDPSQSQPLDYDYNAYWPLTQAELAAQQLNPWSLPNAAQLQPTAYSGDLNGGDERGLTVAPPYQTGPLGSFYPPTSSELYNSLKRGSRAVADAGLYHYTTRTDQLKDGNQTGNVIIGHHYIATSSSAASAPKDTDGDGIADYVENASGDGVYANHIGIETDWQNAHTDTDPNTGTPIADSLNAIYDDVDVDGDGMVGRIEKALGRNALVSDNPLALNFDANDSGLVTFNVPFNYSALSSVGRLNLHVSGGDATLQDFESAGSDCRLVWNSAFSRPGQHYLQARFLITDNGPGGVASAFGPILPFYSANVLQFFASGSMFDDNGAYLDAKLPEANATYTIELYDPSTTPATLIRTIGPKPNGGDGKIQEDWNVKYADDTTPFTGSTVDAIFNVTLTASSGAGKKRMHKPQGAMTEWSDYFNFSYMYTPLNNLLTSEFARDGGVWIGLQGAVEKLIKPNEEYIEYQSFFNGYDANAYPGYLSSQSDVIGLFQTLEFTRQFYCYSHGSPTRLHNAAGDVYIDIAEISSILGNSWSARDGLNTSNPYRFVFLDGCGSAATRDWPYAFGIFHVDDFIDLGRNKVGPQAFVGWAGSFSGWMNTAPGYPAALNAQVAENYTVTIFRFYYDWMLGASLKTCIDIGTSRGQGGNICPLMVPKNDPTIQPYEIEYPGGAAHLSKSFTTSEIDVIGHSGLNRSGLNPDDDLFYLPRLDW